MSCTNKTLALPRWWPFAEFANASVLFPIFIKSERITWFLCALAGSDIAMAVGFRNVVVMPLFFLSGFLVGQLQLEELPTAGKHAGVDARLSTAPQGTEVVNNCVSVIQKVTHTTVLNTQDVFTVLDERVRKNPVPDNSDSLFDVFSIIWGR